MHGRFARHTRHGGNSRMPVPQQTPRFPLRRPHRPHFLPRAPLVDRQEQSAGGLRKQGRLFLERRHGLGSWLLNRRLRLESGSPPTLAWSILCPSLVPECLRLTREGLHGTNAGRRDMKTGLYLPYFLSISATRSRPIIALNSSKETILSVSFSYVPLAAISV